jgi:hypothetical protein
LNVLEAASATPTTQSPIASYNPAVIPVLAVIMATRDRDVDDAGESLDPELLYTKEYCIGQFICHGKS